jgi:hypothetical protein
VLPLIPLIVLIKSIEEGYRMTNGHSGAGLITQPRDDRNITFAIEPLVST